ncbi:Hypothetical protein GbCGDNIH9_2054 [Granulibacter bethesdensis]|uniref:Uncharacterized protein n=1 Tax=Granulibacter bethesdensis TaxID=364410 RepID=A0AAC9KDZ2_9PROT|nr:Hypothetical protein GbCGDNIH9_2054 [Granulibacter bethesdensis]APH62958.1 Hypothetical protein GbCGDNIH8_2054 [Granulibacter bethesdensis]
MVGAFLPFHAVVSCRWCGLHATGGDRIGRKAIAAGRGRYNFGLLCVVEETLTAKLVERISL